MSEAAENKEKTGANILVNKPGPGGVRPGGGRPPGSKNKKTIKQEIAKRAFEQRILRNLNPLLTAQMNLAQGVAHLFRIDKWKDPETKQWHSKHVLVEDSKEIQEVLDTCKGNGVVNKKYYYITTRDPDNRALDSLIDRLFGRAVQRHGGEKEGEPIPILANVIRSDDSHKKDSEAPKAD